MRLVNTRTLQVEEFLGPNIPPYGILSHTWDEAEASYEGMKNGLVSDGTGYKKIKMACSLAVRDDFAYIWIDTCCIDKSSSAELSEAINSMFQWYKGSTICYVYLSDLGGSADLSVALKECRWFTRGWTLQELIAPYEVQFFDQAWKPRGRKRDLLSEISLATGISSHILSHSASLQSLPAATKMSWAASRQTTRPEDAAYCLLGIFDINMPLLYGEGSRAFTRLQEEIIRRTCDLSIFAWKTIACQITASTHSGILAESPRDFTHCGSITRNKQPRFHGDFSVTNKGVRLEVRL
ncbi:heterokaryon incompatibility protein-domain-containing protein, partial [Diaporthe sp. PMI_573]